MGTACLELTGCSVVLKFALVFSGIVSDVAGMLVAVVSAGEEVDSRVLLSNVLSVVRSAMLVISELFSAF
jgi:hypothetical protein